MTHHAWLALVALGPVLACAQALNPAWDGQWAATQTTQGRPDSQLQILRKGARTQIVQAGQACGLVYDGLVEPAVLSRRVQDLKAWQLDAAHWPPGTHPSGLVGLRREFDTALQMIAGLNGTRYRSTRIRGEGCDDADDIFFVLHQGQQLLRLRFPSASLGVDLTLYQKRSPP